MSEKLTKIVIKVFLVIKALKIVKNFSKSFLFPD